MVGGVRAKKPYAGEVDVIVCRIGERVNRVKRKSNASAVRLVVSARSPVGWQSVPGFAGQISEAGCYPRNSSTQLNFRSGF